MFDALKDINSEGATILMVEQNAHLELKFAQRGYVLEGHESDLLENPDVQKVCLGG